MAAIQAEVEEVDGRTVATAITLARHERPVVGAVEVEVGRHTVKRQGRVYPGRL